MIWSCENSLTNTNQICSSGTEFAFLYDLYGNFFTISIDKSQPNFSTSTSGVNNKKYNNSLAQPLG